MLSMSLSWWCRICLYAKPCNAPINAVNKRCFHRSSGWNAASQSHVALQALSGLCSNDACKCDSCCCCCKWSDEGRNGVMGAGMMREGAWHGCRRTGSARHRPGSAGAGLGVSSQASAFASSPPPQHPPWRYNTNHRVCNANVSRPYMPCSGKTIMKRLWIPSRELTLCSRVAWSTTNCRSSQGEPQGFTYIRSPDCRSA